MEKKKKLLSVSAKCTWEVVAVMASDSLVFHECIKVGLAELGIFFQLKLTYSHKFNTVWKAQTHN